MFGSTLTREVPSFDLKWKCRWSASPPGSSQTKFCYSGAVAKGLLLYARSVAYNYNGGVAQHFALPWVNSAANKLLLSYQLNTRKC